MEAKLFFILQHDFLKTYAKPEVHCLGIFNHQNLAIYHTIRENI